MLTITTGQLQADLSTYLQRARSGEHITVVHKGTPLAVLGPPHDKALAREKLKVLSESARLGNVVSPTNSAWHEVS